MENPNETTKPEAKPDCAPMTGSAAATVEVVSWAQCVLTALNVGDVKSGSPLHLKLREVMIAYRASIPEQPNAPHEPCGAKNQNRE